MLNERRHGTYSLFWVSLRNTGSSLGNFCNKKKQKEK